MTTLLSAIASSRGGYIHLQLAGARPAAFTDHVPRPDLTSTKPRISGDHTELLATITNPNDPDGKYLRKMMRNTIKKCPTCGKPCASSTEDCSACGTSITDVPVSYLPNVFTGFLLGLERTSFPLTISIRAQTERFLVFDDPLALTTCHTNGLPTDWYIPDWRYLLADPRRGLNLIEELERSIWNAVKEQFLVNKGYVEKNFAPDLAAEILADPDAALPYVAAGFNYPPSQFQLHLQFMVLPLTPFHAAQFAAKNHFHRGRFFPLEYVRAALQCADTASVTYQPVRADCYLSFEPLPESTQSPQKDEEPAAVVIDWIRRCFAVDYESIHEQFVADVARRHADAAAWRPTDFSYLIVDGAKGVALIDGVPFDKRERIQQIHKDDKLILQNYGRPYDADGEPTGTYYRYARDFRDIKPWAGVNVDE